MPIRKFQQCLFTGIVPVAMAVLTISGCFPSDSGEPPPVEEPAFATQWTWRNPLPHGHNMGAVVSNNNVRLIFSEAGVMRSVNGGGWQIHAMEAGLSSAVWDGNQFIGVGTNRFATSPDGITWTYQHLPQDTVHFFYDVVWTGSLAVAVGWGYPEAAIFTSPDGLVWTKRSSVGAVSLAAVTWTGSLFVAVGSAGELRTSPDGITWMARPRAANNGLSDIVWTGTQVVAVGGDQGTVRTSPDGITWTARSSGATYDHADFSAITWTGSLLVASKLNGKLLTSPDGINWTLRTTVPFWINQVAWTGSEVLAVGEEGALFSSSNGINWTSHVSGSRANLACVAWNGQRFVAVGEEGAVLTSPDGVEWDEEKAGNTDLAFVTWTGTQWVAVGQGGAIRTSPDGDSWTSRMSGVTVALRDVKWGGGLLVALGDKGTVLTSPDGATWTARTSGTTEYLNTVLWDGSRWLAGGGYGTLLESSDGVAWSVRVIEAPVNYGDGLVVGAWLSSIVWTGSEYFITVPGMHPIRSGYLLHSPDGVTWTRRNGSVLSLGFWLNGHFVGIRDGSDYPTEATIMIATSDSTWESKGMKTTNSLSSIAWGNGRLVAVGYQGTIFSSP